MSERCGEVKRYRAMRKTPVWARPLVWAVKLWKTKVRGLHPMLASQHGIIHWAETKPVEVRCECVAGHDGSHLHGGLLWWENRMLFYGSKAMELGFGRKALDDLTARRIFANRGEQ